MNRDVFIVGRTPRTAFILKLVFLTVGFLLLCFDDPPISFSEGNNPAYWDRVFWVLIGQAFVMSWWSFEILFRPAYAAIIVRLPLSSNHWFLGTLSKLLEPLLGILSFGICMTVPMYEEGSIEGFVFMLSLVVSFSFGIWGGTLWLYTALLGSLKTPGPLRDSLSKGLPSPEAALLFYAPALAFGAAAVLLLGVIFGIRVALLSAVPESGLIAVIVPFMIGLIGVIKGRTHFMNMFPKHFATFTETERVLPFAEHELPGREEMGWGLSNGPVAIQAVELSNRRAFRVDPLFWLLGFILVAGGLQTAEPAHAFAGGFCIPFIFPFAFGRTMSRAWTHQLFPDQYSPPPGHTVAQWARRMTLSSILSQRSIPTLTLIGLGAISTEQPLFCLGGALAGYAIAWTGGLLLTIGFIQRSEWSHRLSWLYTGLTILLLGFVISIGGQTV